ncbi:hypothetical protein NP493_817g01013 [Ridgeia piscesae]|uniref:RUN domain-containing protein n=1 Tax=Ridgeia piscesae TaxID=27915 RepID=A0AAD9KMW4_RIDPI|nr:hypothetical protein NP493_817g01013 [Ridgeia piscesae]
MMEETSGLSDGGSYDSLDEDGSEERPAERWAPLGAANVSPPASAFEASIHAEEMERLQSMEEEQEHLNNSLFALTTHFAQVQFRLKQIVSAPADVKEDLLKELEEFAFKGIPDMRECSLPSADPHSDDEDNQNDKDHDLRLNEQREKQYKLINQLKSQLEDLETYAYEMGEAELPSSKVMEKQNVIINELKDKLDLNLEHFDHLGSEELRQVVDHAINRIVNPARVKEKLVDQLKTQITDLERFIEYLQGEADTPGPFGKKCACPVHGGRPEDKADCHLHARHAGDGSIKSSDTVPPSKTTRDSSFSILKQALTMLQIFTISQMGCGSREFHKNILKRTSKGNHWGDLRARLELAVERVSQLVKEQEQGQTQDSDYTSDSEDAPIVQCNRELTTAVRKELAVALRDLLQHGLMEVGQSSSLVPFGCLPNRSKKPMKMMHAWDLVLKFYEMKHGKEYNDTPARKLSQSFSLDIVGGKAVTVKQTLLSAIEDILSTHTPLKRSEDSQFKAFVCNALNQKKLVPWLRLILRTATLIEFYYQPWSYVIKTGFDDTLITLDSLSRQDFNLPVDLAIRPFQNIKDAF